MTWNIWSGENWPQVAQFIQDHRIDIVGLQEVDNNLERTGRIDVARKIADTLSYHFAYSASIENQTTGKTAGGEFGNAVISRFPITASNRHFLSSPTEWQGTSETEPRTLLETTIEVAGKKLRFLTLHLGYAREFATTPIKIRQITKVTKILADKKDTPTILLGDFNSLPQSQEIQEIKKYLRDVDDKNLLRTWTTHDFSYKDWQVPAGLNFKIDYIFVSQDIQYGSPTSAETTISDHVPVIVELQL